MQGVWPVGYGRRAPAYTCRMPVDATACLACEKRELRPDRGLFAAASAAGSLRMKTVHHGCRRPSTVCLRSTVPTLDHFG